MNPDATPERLALEKGDTRRTLRRPRLLPHPPEIPRTPHAKHPPLKELIHVYVDPRDVFRTDHTLAFAGLQFLKLH